MIKRKERTNRNNEKGLILTEIDWNKNMADSNLRIRKMQILVDSRILEKK